MNFSVDLMVGEGWGRNPEVKEVGTVWGEGRWRGQKEWDSLCGGNWEKTGNILQ